MYCLESGSFSSSPSVLDLCNFLGKATTKPMLPQKRSFINHINLHDVRGKSSQNIAKGSDIDIISRLSSLLVLFGVDFKCSTCRTCEKTFAQELVHLVWFGFYSASTSFLPFHFGRLGLRKETPQALGPMTSAMSCGKESNKQKFGHLGIL